MTTRIWAGGSGDWMTAALWSGGTAPARGDVAAISAGSVTIDSGTPTVLESGATLSSTTLDAVTVDLGAPAGAPGGAATLMVVTTDLGNGLDLLSTGTHNDAVLVAAGIVGLAGSLDAASFNGTLTIQTVAAGGESGDFVLRDGATATVGGGGTLAVDGLLTNNGRLTIGSTGVLALNGTIAEASAAIEVQSGAALLGAGTVEIGLFSSLTLDQSGATGIAVDFTDIGGRLILGNGNNFAGTIEGFRSGDIINLVDVPSATEAVVTGGVLAVLDGSAIVATLHVAGLADGTLAVVGESTSFDEIGHGGIDIVYPGATEPRLTYLAAADARAVNAPMVNAETLADGTHITGAGIKIGIISNSFNIDGDADADAQNGYLPENPDGTSAVAVLSEGDSGGDDEGRAMAELIHQIAPGATLDFASGDSGLAGFADAVQALAADGCNIIVDDLSYTLEPFFAPTGTLDAAIEAAIAGGVSYFTSAGNIGNAVYGAAFDPQAEVINGSAVTAHVFGNGTPYQKLTLFGGVTASIALQWDAPASAAGTAPVQIELFQWSGATDASGNPIPSGAPMARSGVPNDVIAPEVTLSFTVPVTGTYLLAIAGSLAAGTQFRYVLVGSVGDATTVAGSIDDNAAGDVGSIYGHALLPGVNAVGAVNFPDTPAFGSNAPATDYYSATGDAGSGKPDFVAPVDAGTAVPGISPFDGTSAAAANAAAVAALVLQADPSLTPAELSSVLEDSAVSVDEPGTLQGAGLIQADRAVALALALDAPCFEQGTRVLTERGETAVEKLRVGDRVRTAEGRWRPIIWLGRRTIDTRRHPRPHDVWPVRVRAHAFAAGAPARDLLLSPDHAVAVDDALVPIRYLRNGATIVQEPRARVTYWHVELASHDVLLAEGLTAETYLDTGNRAAFAGGAAGHRAEAALRVWAERGCRPLLREGLALHRLHARLLRRALRLGHRLEGDAALRLMADGAPVDVGVEGYVLPRGTRRVRLLSRHWSPAEQDAAAPDGRRLGVAVAEIELDGAPVPLHDRRLGAGWHAPEPGWRWTGGDAVLQVRGAHTLRLSLAMTGRYWSGATRAV